MTTAHVRGTLNDRTQVGRVVRDAGAGPALEAVAISKRFGTVQAVADASLHVYAGEIVALVGENGAGKSTLLRALVGDDRADSGEVFHRGRRLDLGVGSALERGVSMVWQDLALCDNLDSVENIFLGRERGQRMLADADMRNRAMETLEFVGIAIPDLDVPVGRLPAGQRQAVALGRAILQRPSVLMMDEPTSALGVAESRQVGSMMKRLAAEGTAVLFVTHDLDEVFRLADRVLVMRQGKITADASRQELHPDDLAALISGVRVDTTASQQLRLLSSLDEQISTAEPSMALPLTVTAMANAVSAEMLSVYLTSEASPGRLVRTAVIGLTGPLLEANSVLDIGDSGGSVGRAADRQEVVVVENVAVDPLWSPFLSEARSSGVQSTWAVPIIGQSLIGVVAGYATTVGRPRQDQLDLVALFASQAAAVVDRTRLISELSNQNRHLEGIRGVLESLSGPDAVTSGIPSALLALCNGTRASAACLYEFDTDVPVNRRFIMFPEPGSVEAVQATARIDRAEPTLVGTVNDLIEEIDHHIVCVRFSTPDGDLALVAHWDDPGDAKASHDLMVDATKSFRIALERQRLEESRRESDALRRSNDLQRGVMMRLSHELRTPLTAIHGFASSMGQPDIEWLDADRNRFLAKIESESSRVIRLVDDLFDSSAIEAGILRLERDWCQLPLVVGAAVDVVPNAGEVTTVADFFIEPVWADHDRLQQVFVNLISNAVRHNPPGTRIRIEPVKDAPEGRVGIRVIDNGDGLPQQMMTSLLRGTIGDGAHRGLGLKIATGIVESHGGSLIPEHVTSGGTSFLISLPAEPPANNEVSDAEGVR